MDAMIDDETLDRQLREVAPYIDDEGFTARVMAKLPAARREPQWLRAVILVGLTLLGSGVAYFLSGGGRFVWYLRLKLFTASTVLTIGNWRRSRSSSAAGEVSAISK